jgi:hypothetical protein
MWLAGKLDRGVFDWSLISAANFLDLQFFQVQCQKCKLSQFNAVGAG